MYSKTIKSYSIFLRMKHFLYIANFTTTVYMKNNLTKVINSATTATPFRMSTALQLTHPNNIGNNRLFKASEQDI